MNDGFYNTYRESFNELITHVIVIHARQLFELQAVRDIKVRNGHVFPIYLSSIDLVEGF